MAARVERCADLVRRVLARALGDATSNSIDALHAGGSADSSDPLVLVPSAKRPDYHPAEVTHREVNLLLNDSALLERAVARWRLVERGWVERERHPPAAVALTEAGFAPPRCYLLGLRPYILMVPFTMVLPACLLLALLPLANLAAALALALFLSLSAWRMCAEDVRCAAARAPDTPYSRGPNGYQFTMVTVLLPLQVASLTCLASPAVVPHPLLALLALPALLVFKNGVCMSVILHRWAAHAAFHVPTRPRAPPPPEAPLTPLDVSRCGPPPGSSSPPSAASPSRAGRSGGRRATGHATACAHRVADPTQRLRTGSLIYEQARHTPLL